jgi:alpha-beta hydrolase superfamily lysophospholipase
VILLHGLTDAPDSQRHIARAYRDRSFVAVVIRLPAHGRETGDEGSRWTFGDMIAFILDLMRDRAGPSPAPP